MQKFDLLQKFQGDHAFLLLRANTTQEAMVEKKKKKEDRAWDVRVSRVAKSIWYSKKKEEEIQLYQRSKLNMEAKKWRL